MGDTFRTRTNGAVPQVLRTGLIAALDAGSSKIACIIARAESGAIRVLGSALHESQGIKAGSVVSLDLAEQSIREAVETAERLADERIQDVILSVQCGQPRSVAAQAELDVGGELVTDAHLRALIADGKRRCGEDGYQTIQASPTGYVVDQSRGISDPRGMFCERLGVVMHGVAVRQGPLQNLRLAVERSHLTIARQLPAAYASALATLSPDEMALGATLVDFGAGCTSVAVFMDNELVHVQTIPMGGALVTYDIARMLSTPLAAAERIKSLYGAAIGDFTSGHDMIEVPEMGESGEKGGTRVRRSLVMRIIHSRVEEILIEVRDRLKESGFDVAAGRRLVLTGGGCQLAGARELTASVLNKQVRIGRPQTFPGLAEATAGPAYATAVGLLIAGATSPADMNEPERRRTHAVAARGAGWKRWIGAGLFG